ncbi:MAG TPA: hypothetical protein VFE13_19480 [Caulobacteraceae bacterium]|jgi:autotransporter passenger strand-loop-strand repeat protein|nr:hypothetical protein [Caulobacteraceae bacterium]
MTKTTVSSGGTASGLVAAAGDEIAVRSGGATVDSTVLSGGLESAAHGALVDAATVSAGGVLLGHGEVGSATQVYGTVRNVSVRVSTDTGAGLLILEGGRSENVTVEVGAWEDVFPQGLAIGGVIFDKGVLLDHGAVSGAIASSGDLMVQAGGKASGDVIGEGGFEVIDWLNDTSGMTTGGVARHETILSGGAMQISAGGATFDTTVSAGAVETVYASGRAIRTLLSGGDEFVYGLASKTMVEAGARQIIRGGGFASGSVIESGGRAVVSSGGAAQGITVSGGTLIVSSGGVLSGGLVIEGGLARISGSMAAGVVRFTGSAGVLGLDNLPDFHGKIAGLQTAAEKIDISGFAFSPGGESADWAQHGTSGTLTVTDGGKVEKLILIGAYTSSSFQLSADGKGGTFVALGGAGAAARPAQLAQTMAGLVGGRSMAEAGRPGDAAVQAAALPLVGPATSGR